MPVVVGSGTPVIGVEIAVPLLTTGTVTSPIPTNANLKASLRRTNYASAAGAGSSAGWRSGIVQAWRGDAAALGGFFLQWRFGFSTAVAQQRAFIGLINAVGVIGNVNPSTLVDLIGVSYDSAQTQLRVIRSDTAGPAVVVDLGANAPVDATTLYELTMSAAPNGSAIVVRVVNLTTGAVVSNDVSYSTTIPAAGTFLAPQGWVNNGTTAAAAGLDMVSGYQSVRL